MKTYTADFWLDAREHMVKHQLMARDITDPRVLQAMLQVPREQFVDPVFRRFIYRDMPVTIGYGQTISQPYIVAKMCELLELTGDETVLDVGTGSGYQAAVLSHLARKVISIERLQPLAVRAKKRLRELNYKNVTVITGDGFKGYKKHAPYDAIVAAAAGRFIPPPWKEQLVDGGVIVLPLKKRRYQLLMRLTREHDTFTIEEFGKVAFVPLVSRE